MQLQRVEFSINNGGYYKWWDEVEDADDESLMEWEWDGTNNNVKIHVLYVPGESSNLTYKIFLYLLTLDGSKVLYGEALPDEGGPPE